MTNIKYIFFDLDHTLWDFDKNSRIAFIKIFKLHDIELNYESFFEIYEPINVQYWRWYRENRVTKQQLRYGRLKKTFDKLGFSVTDDIIHRLSDDYIKYLPEFNHLFDGVIDVLTYLKSKYELHIITNGFEEVQHLKISKSGLSTYFKTITTSERVGAKKPNSKIFKVALSDAGAQIDNSIMIGDSYEADIVGAQNIGMKAIYFNYHQSEPPQDSVVINQISDLKECL